jgi:hypothetical protein
MKYYNITINQFCDFATKNSIQRYHSAQNIYKQITSDYDTKIDYWAKLRNRIKHVLSTTGMAQDLDGLEDEVPQDRKDNYLTMVSALKKFWGKKKFESVEAVSKKWRHGKVCINVQPQLCYAYRGKVHIVDMYLKIHDENKLDRRKADLILQIMHDALKLDEDVILELLDVARHRIYAYRDSNAVALSTLIEVEAEELGNILSKLGK